jgi:flavin-dependent dehydrogenase
MVIPLSLESHLVERLIIVGGGVAGLACLNALLDQGVTALLLEAGTIGTPKMCGEFLAPPALAQLEKWGIGPIQIIKQASFFAKDKNLNLTFQQPAGAYARSNLELQLAERARRLGGKILEKSPIQKIVPAEGDAPYLFYLASGEELQAETAIFATGKFSQQANHSSQASYYGIKLHFPQIVKPATLLMYSQPGTYFGIVPISDTTSNCACLAKRDVVEKIGSCKQFFYHLVENNQTLQHVFQQIDLDNLAWLEGLAPEFGLRNIPDWPRALWIGDALASLHPAVGYGFAHSVESAVMAADAYCQHHLSNYHQAATQLIKPKLRLGRLMHRILLQPLLGAILFPFARINPWIVRIFMRKMGYD